MEMQIKSFSKGDATSGSHKLYAIKEFINHTIPLYHLIDLPDRYSQAMLKKSELLVEENQQVMKKWICECIHFWKVNLLSIWKTKLQAT